MIEQFFSAWFILLRLTSTATSLPLSENRPLEVSQTGSEAGTSQELTRGSAFILVATLGLGSVYQPFSGSLIFGPCSRFWRLSPLSALLEICVVAFHIGASIADQFSLPFLPVTTSGVGAEFTLSDTAYALIISRALNAPPGARKRQEELELRKSEWKSVPRRPYHDSEAKALYDFYESLVSELHEGWRNSLGLSIPIFAQFVKLMAVNGSYSQTLLPKTLGAIYSVHWLLMELLLLVAKFSRVCDYKSISSDSSSSIYQVMGDIITKVDELMITHMRLYNWYKRTGSRYFINIKPALGSWGIDWRPSKLYLRSTIAQENRHNIHQVSSDDFRSACAHIGLTLISKSPQWPKRKRNGRERIFLEDFNSACLLIGLGLIHESDSETREGDELWFPRGEHFEDFEDEQGKSLRDKGMLIDEKPETGQFDQMETWIHGIHIRSFVIVGLIVLLIGNIVGKSVEDVSAKLVFSIMGFGMAIFIAIPAGSHRSYQSKAATLSTPCRTQLSLPRYQLLRNRWVYFRATNDAHLPILQEAGINAGIHVGGDLGMICIGLWILWCIVVYNPNGTHRPDWPWLDWLA